MSAKTNTGRSRARQATYAAGGASRTRAHWRDGDPSLATGRAIGSLDQREETQDRHQQYKRETSRDGKEWRRTYGVARGDERPDSPSRRTGQALKSRIWVCGRRDLGASIHLADERIFQCRI